MSAAFAPRPNSMPEAVVELLHGVSIADPFRWLEDQDSPRTRCWLTEQTAYTRAYFDRLPARALIRRRIAELLTVDVYDRPVEVAGRTFFLRREAQQEQPCITMRTHAAGEDLVLINPAHRGEGATVAVQILAVSADARLMAYGVKHGGEDTLAVELLDIETRTVLSESLPRGALRGLVFAPDGRSFVYSHRAITAGASDPFRIRRHRLGEAFEHDETVLEIPADPSVKGIGVTPSGGELLLFVVNRLSGGQRISDVYLYDPARRDTPRLLIGEMAGSCGLRFAGDRLIAVTCEGAPNGRIVEVSLQSGEQREIVSESSCRIQNFAISGEKIYVVYAAEDRTRLAVYSLDAEPLEPPNLPPGTITNIWSYSCNAAVFVELTSFTLPRTIYRIDPEGVSLWSRWRVPFDPSGVQVRRVWFPSRDGTRVPMFLIGKHLDAGPRPTVLSAYGGFGTSITPQFTAYGTYLIEQGCTLAIAGIRGGSEFGVAWHEAAKREKRQNAFDDFFAAAEWLIESGYATRDRLGIVGGSNAGLLVGVAVTARPELFRAAVCLGPLLDMLRYHRFGNARFWLDEYGCAENPNDFRHLYAYSPYHRVRDGEEYPAVLFISGDQDKRCDASHARKMTARLQQANASGRPILLDYQAARGHSHVLPLQVRIEGLTDRLAFLCDQLGVEVH